MDQRGPENKRKKPKQFEVLFQKTLKRLQSASRELIHKALHHLHSEQANTVSILWTEGLRNNGNNPTRGFEATQEKVLLYSATDIC